MSLKQPIGFPDPYWLPVLSAEATARARLLKALARVHWQRAGRTNGYLHWDAVKQAVAKYLTAVVEAFAGQACLAVRARQYPAIMLDSTVEGFIELALHQAYYGLGDEKIGATWSGSRIEYMTKDMLPLLRSAPWHARYLAELPEVLAAVAAEGAPADADAPHAKAGRRAAKVALLLAAKGWSTAQWANAAGVSQTIAYDYMNGKSDPRAENRKALATALGLDVADLPT